MKTCQNCKINLMGHPGRKYCGECARSVKQTQRRLKGTQLATDLPCQLLGELPVARTIQELFVSCNEKTRKFVPEELVHTARQDALFDAIELLEKAHAREPKLTEPMKTAWLLGEKYMIDILKTLSKQ